jgi:hypothetical protein
MALLASAISWFYRRSPERKFCPAGDFDETPVISTATIENCMWVYASSTGTRHQIFIGKTALFALQPLGAMISYNPGATGCARETARANQSGKASWGALPAKIFSLSPQ